MRLVGAGGALLLLVAAAAMPACSGENLGGGGGRAGTGGASPSGTFTPAVEPAAPCPLLSLADVQTILPAAGAGVPQPGSTSPEGWGLECDWKVTALGGPDVSLVVVGVVTSDGIADLDRGLQSVAYDGASSMAVSGLGDAAEYTDSTNFQILAARTGAYLIQVTVDFVTPDVTAAQLRPLVAKVLGEL